MKKYYLAFIIMVSTIAFLANSAQHPTNPNGGYTGAPLDGVCLECHTNQNNNLSGSFDIIGIPRIAIYGESYRLEITITNPENDALRAGFQMVALEEDLSNAGTFISEGSNALVKIAKGRTYIGHSPAIEFNENNTASWITAWIPEENDLGKVTIYGAGMIASGSEGNKRDRAIFRKWETIVKSPEDTIDVQLNLINPVSCSDSSDASLSLNVLGGVPPLQFMWHTGIDTFEMSNLPSGRYSVTVTDSIGNSDIDSIIVANPDPLIINNIEIEDASSEGNSDGKITISVEGGNPPYDVNWIALPNDTISSNNESLDSIPSGNYQAIIRDATGCELESGTLVVMFSTSTKSTEEKGIFIYPNPSDGNITIKGIEEFTSLSIINLHGRIISIKEINGASTNLELDVNPGIYFIGLTHQSGKLELKKVIIY